MTYRSYTCHCPTRQIVWVIASYDPAYPTTRGTYSMRLDGPEYLQMAERHLRALRDEIYYLDDMHAPMSTPVTLIHVPTTTV